jgi:alpha-methylacyl-CoA racemase
MAAELAGTTVLDLAGIGPSPRCARVLADLGARWIRVTPPATAGRLQPQWHHYGAWRGAEVITIDLKHDEGRATFLRLAQQADVILESFRPGVADRLGVGYATVRAVNHRAIYCAITGYGQSGPYAQRAGHDLNYQALAGALACIGRREDGSPAVPGLTLADSAGGGWQAVIRILAALLGRHKTGEGRYLDVSASEGVLHLMAIAIDEYLATGKAPAAGEGMLTGGYAFYDIYSTSDSKHLAVAAIETKFFANLCRALDLEQMIDRQFEKAAQPEIRDAFAAAFKRRSQAEWIARLGDLDACVTPVLSIAEVTADAHWQARDMFCAFDHPDRGAVRQLSCFGDGGSRGSASDTATDAVLLSLGFSAAEVAALKRSGAVA